jgi:hypothetical protein
MDVIGGFRMLYFETRQVQFALPMRVRAASMKNISRKLYFLFK